MVIELSVIAVLVSIAVVSGIMLGYYKGQQTTHHLLDEMQGRWESRDELVEWALRVGFKVSETLEAMARNHHLSPERRAPRTKFKNPKSLAGYRLVFLLSRSRKTRVDFQIRVMEDKGITLQPIIKDLRGNVLEGRFLEGAMGSYQLNFKLVGDRLDYDLFDDQTHAEMVHLMSLVQAAIRNE